MKAPGGRFLLLPGLLSLTPTGPHILLFCHLRQKLEKICDMICSNDNSSNGKCDGIKTPTRPHILLFCHLRQKLEKICDMICSNDNSSNGKCDGIKTPLGHHLTGLPTFLCHLNLTRAQFTF